MKAMRTRIFFYADPHFGHANIIRYCKRPFANVKEMNGKLIKNYNHLIMDSDIVYFLGDVGLGKSEELMPIFKKLKGKKILIKGNHDKASKSFYRTLGFFDVLDSARITLGKNVKVNLQHFPNRSFIEVLEVCKCYMSNKEGRLRSLRNRWNRVKKELRKYRDFKKDRKYYTLCGHVHDRWLIRSKNINVSVDQWNFFPVSEDSILRMIRLEDK